jgi:hypothetical protein
VFGAAARIDTGMPPQSRLGRVEDKAGGAIGIAAAVCPH